MKCRSSIILGRQGGNSDNDLIYYDTKHEGQNFYVPSLGDGIDLLNFEGSWRNNGLVQVDYAYEVWNNKGMDSGYTAPFGLGCIANAGGQYGYSEGE